MPSFSSHLRVLEATHGRAITYLSIRNSEYLRKVTASGANACQELFQSIEDYINCIMQQNQSKLYKSVKSHADRYCHNLELLRAEIKKNELTYINSSILTNSLSAWSQLWANRKAFSYIENNECDFNRIVDLNRAIWN